MVRTRLISAATLAGVLLVAPLARAGNPGEVGMLSLRMGLGAREAAMGGAAVAVAEGAAAVFWNPANNALRARGTDLVLQHQRYLGLFNHEAAAVTHRAGGGVLGLMFSGLYADEQVRRGEDAIGIPEGTFRSYQVAFGLSYARRIGDRFAAGANVKYVYETIDIDAGSAMAFDVFVAHEAMIEGLYFGASLTNLGNQLTVSEEPYDLPAAARVGVAYTPVGGALRGRLTLAADMFLPNDTSEKTHVGAEYRLLDEFAVRAGTRLNYDNQGLTAGAGFRSGRLGLDYAYEESKVSGLDDGHKFSLALTW